MRTHLFLLASSLLWIGCGSSSESTPNPVPANDAAPDQTSDAAPEAEPDAGPDGSADASPEADAAQPDTGADAGPSTRELLLQDGTSDRIVPHLAVRGDGTAFLSWYALGGGVYPIRMQRIDTTGHKLWAEDGVPVSALDSTSWVMDYDLASNAQGNAILAYSNTTDFVLRVQSIDDQGAPAWGQGTVLTDAAQGAQAFTPHVVLCSDGAMAVAWDESRTSGADTTEHVAVQRVDASGQAVWSPAFSVDPEAGLSPQFSQVLAAGDGSVIVVWVENGGVNYPGDAYAQRVDVDGKAVWSSKKKITGAAQLAFPMKPLLAPDGQGGFFAAWTALVGAAGFEGRIQHFDADGLAAWDAEGLKISTDTAMMQLPSALVYAPGSSRLVVGWKRTDPDQNFSGLSLQAFDGQGAMLWNEPGLELVAADANEGALAAALQTTSDGVAMFFAKGPVNGMDLTAHVAAVPLTAGAGPQVTDLSTTASGKSHPAVSALVGGGYWLAWEDSRGGHPVIYGAWWPSP